MLVRHDLWSSLASSFSLLNKFQVIFSRSKKNRVDGAEKLCPKLFSSLYIHQHTVGVHTFTQTHTVSLVSTSSPPVSSPAPSNTAGTGKDAHN